LDERALPVLLQQASDRQSTPQERLVRFEAIFDQLPARDGASGPLHARCLRAILTLIDPVERRDLFLHYHRRHRFQLRTDPTPRLFALVSELQKPEHRPTPNAWASAHAPTIAQRQRRVQLRRVLGQAAVAHLHMPAPALDGPPPGRPGRHPP
jgi:hypothetical protein